MDYDEPIGDETDPMGTAQFKTMRQALGLAADDVAQQCGVTLRTAQRWEKTHTPPADAAAWLSGLWAQRAAMIANSLDTMAETVDEYDEPRAVEVSRFASLESFRRTYPDGDAADWKIHSATVGLLAMSVAVEGYKVRVGWAPVEE